jgi:hypothetical protein
MHTEDEAKNLWCPMVRLTFARIDDNGKVEVQAHQTAVNRMGQVGTPNSLEMVCARCIASQCAMWRWGLYETRSGDTNGAPFTKRERGVVEPARPTAGFCGLAGRPS